jgi:hypothetical protein
MEVRLEYKKGVRNAATSIHANSVISALVPNLPSLYVYHTDSMVERLEALAVVAI